MSTAPTVNANEPAPGTAEAEAMLRRHMAMYDWTKRETVAINDYILTVSEGIAEDLADFAEAITLLRVGVSGTGWDAGDLSRAEELVERHGKST